MTRCESEMETTPRTLRWLRRKAMSCLSEFWSYLEFGTLHDRISKAVCTKIVMSKLSHTYKTKKINEYWSEFEKWMQKPYTEKQKAKNRTCIQPSVTNFPRVDLNRKKEQNKQPMPVSPACTLLLRWWVGNPPFSVIPHSPYWTTWFMTKTDS